MSRLVNFLVLVVGVCGLTRMAISAEPAKRAAPQQKPFAERIDETLRQFGVERARRGPACYPKWKVPLRRLLEECVEQRAELPARDGVMGEYFRVLQSTDGHVRAREIIRPFVRDAAGRVHELLRRPPSTAAEAHRQLSGALEYADWLINVIPGASPDSQDLEASRPAVFWLIHLADRYEPLCRKLGPEAADVTSALLHEAQQGTWREADWELRHGRRQAAFRLYDRATRLVERGLETGWGARDGRPASVPTCWRTLDHFWAVSGDFLPPRGSYQRRKAYLSLRTWLLTHVQAAEAVHDLARAADGRWLLANYDYYAVAESVKVEFPLAIYEAEEAVRTARAITEAAVRTPVERRADAALAVIRGEAGDAAGAREARLAAIRLDRAATDPESRTRLRVDLVELASAELDLGYLEDGEAHLQECERLAVEQGVSRNLREEEGRHAVSAELFEILGQSGRARQEYEAIATPLVGNRWTLYELALGRLLESESRRIASLDLRSLARRHYREAKAQLFEGDPWLRQGGWEAEACLRMLDGDVAGARRAWKLAERLAIRRGNAGDRAWIQLALGRSFLRTPAPHELPAATHVLNAALAYAYGAMKPFLQWECLLSRAELRWRAGDATAALNDLETAAGIAERLRNRSGFSSDERASLLPDAGAIYRLAAQICLQQRRPQEAYRWARRYKGQEIRRRLFGAPDLGVLTAAQRSGLDIAEAEETRSRREVGRRSAELLDPVMASRRRDIASRLAQAQRALRLASQGVQSTIARTLDFAVPQRLADLKTLQALVLARGVVLADYLVTEDTTFLFVLDGTAARSDGRLPALQVFAVPVSRTWLSRVVDQVVSNCSDASARPFSEEERRLARSLVGPIDPEFRRVAPLVVVPDGPLHRLPWDVLPLPGDRYLLQQRTVALEPSAEAFLHAQAQPARSGRGIVFARSYREPSRSFRVSLRRSYSFGSLPYALEEGRRAADALPAQLLEERDATPEGLLEAVGGARPGAKVVWYAGHAYYDSERPSDSGLLLDAMAGDRGKVTVRDLLALPESRLAGPDLVVLSGCDTARGQPATGEGLLGMLWALQLRGANTVVGCQWPVRDRSQAALMERFAENLHRMDRGEALRAAKLSLLAGKEFTHPYFWAAPVLEGGIGPLGPVEVPPLLAARTWITRYEILIVVLIGSLAAVLMFLLNKTKRK